MSISETDQTRILFERGQRLGTIPAEITWDEVLEYNKGITWLCNDHLFRALKSKGLITDAEYEEYFRLNFGDHRLEIPPLYDFKTVKEIVELIHAAGGIAIIAHPANQLQYIDRLIEWGIDGIEVWHSDLVRASKRNAEKTGIYVDQQEQALRIALEKNLYISGGSDHSGLCGGLYELSDNPEQEWYYTEPLSTGTTKEYFEEIRDRRKNRK